MNVGATMDGVIVLRKEAGMTSHDAVRAVMRITGADKAGHAGTLDPMATGVLPVMLGRATRLSRYLMAGDKEYRGVMLLGLETDTLDIEGRVLRRSDASKVDRREIERAFAGMCGETEQEPPMFSALKVSGKKLYELARQGLEVRREKRRVRIDYIRITGFGDCRAEFEIRCSKGTYIRSITMDAGTALGCGGCLEKLERTRSGAFSIGQSLTLAELENATGEGRLVDCIIPASLALGNIPAVEVGPGEAEKIKSGRQDALSSMDPGPGYTGPFRIISSGNLIAVAEKSVEGSELSVVFN
jgi:tRNA pseudouridine55 synthase